MLKVPVIHRSPMYMNYGPGCLLESDTRLYDLIRDPGQDTPCATPRARGEDDRQDDPPDAGQ